MERTSWNHARFARVSPTGKKQQGAALHPLGRLFYFLLGRNGHDGSANASPDPLLLAPDPMSWYIASRQDGTWAVTPGEAIFRSQRLQTACSADVQTT